MSAFPGSYQARADVERFARGGLKPAIPVESAVNGSWLAVRPAPDRLEHCSSPTLGERAANAIASVARARPKRRPHRRFPGGSIRTLSRCFARCIKGSKGLRRMGRLRCPIASSQSPAPIECAGLGFQLDVRLQSSEARGNGDITQCGLRAGTRFLALDLGSNDRAIGKTLRTMLGRHSSEGRRAHRFGSASADRASG